MKPQRPNPKRTTESIRLLKMEKRRRPGVGIGIFIYNEKDEVLVGKRLSK